MSVALLVFAALAGCGSSGGGTGGQNQSPVADFTITPQTGTTATAFTFNSSSTTDDADSLANLQFAWDFGTGTFGAFASTTSVQHTFAVAGTYTVRVQAKDTQGLLGTKSIQLVVGSGAQSPTARLDAPNPGSGSLTTTTFQFDASTSTDPVDALAALQFAWDPGSGTFGAFSTVPTFSTSFATVGAKTVRVRVKNTAGLTNDASATVTVNTPAAPFVISTFGAATYTPGVGMVITLNATPAAGTGVFAVEDAPPAGWVVSNITGGGAFDAVAGKVKWGPFFDNTQRNLAYTATPPGGATGSVTFVGTGSFDGSDTPVVGQRVIIN
jgi:hypothetical protein